MIFIAIVLMKKWMRRSKYNVAKLRFSCWITNVFEQNISVIYLVLRTSLFLLFNDKKMNENT